MTVVEMSQQTWHCPSGGLTADGKEQVKCSGIPPPPAPPAGWRPQMLKFRSPSRTRWIVLGLGILGLCVLIIVIVLAVHFTGGEKKEDKNQKSESVAGIHTTVAVTTTTRQPTTSRSSAPTSSTPFLETKVTSTEGPIKTTSAYTGIIIEIETDYTERTTNPTEQTTSTYPNEQTTSVFQGSTESTPVVTTTNAAPLPTPDTPGLLGYVTIFSTSDVHLMEAPLFLTCHVLNLTQWQTIQIVHNQGDEANPVVEVSPGQNGSEVVLFDTDFEVDMDEYMGVMLTLSMPSMDCSHVGRYSCVVDTGVKQISESTEITAILDAPRLEFSQIILENDELSLECSATVIGSEGRIDWKIRPPGSNTFMDYSITPDNNSTVGNCSTHLRSVLTFTPQMYDNGSLFRCEVITTDISQFAQNYAEREFLVLSKDICDDQRPFSVKSHPYFPCSHVVYCMDTGPREYQINCPAGTCYDINLTGCVPRT